MPNRTYQSVRNGNYGESIYFRKHSEYWNRSPRVKGKLILKSNQFAKQSAWMNSYSPANAGGAYHLTKNPDDPSTFLGKETGFASLEAETYAKFRGKLYKGSASLGVTFGSYKQSRSMIVSRYQQLSGRADLVIAEFIRRPPTRKRVASFHLEVIFGWVPLLKDIIASCTTVIQEKDRYDWVRASARSQSRFSRKTLSNVLRQDIGVNSRVVRAGQVLITNPNRWLAERAGLSNPATVAWDLVPWSFVVNMFVNTGQLVNSITDFAGLTFPNSSTTRFCVYTCSEVAISTASKPVYYGQASFRALSKVTELGAVARPPLVLKMPDVNWELAAMAASLFTQKFSKTLRLAQPVNRKYRKRRPIDWTNLSDKS